MITLDLNALTVSQDGAQLGHVFDVVRNQPLLIPEIKGIFDRAWIDREEQHSAFTCCQKQDHDKHCDEITTEHEKCASELEDAKAEIKGLSAKLDTARKEVAELTKQLAKADPMPQDLDHA
jgi:peptidoglycan hydrolase CwlO-like protein